MIKKIVILIITLAVVLSILRIEFVRNHFIKPIGNLVYNFQKGNFKEHKTLTKIGINIQVNKYLWTYDIKQLADSITINFTGPTSNFENKHILADMHIFTDSLDSQTFMKLSEVNIGSCKIRKFEIKKKNGYQMNYTLCKNDDSALAHFDIPNKKIMITVYPYKVQNEKLISEFMTNIQID